MNIQVQDFCIYMFSVLLGMHQGVELLGYMIMYV